LPPGDLSPWFAVPVEVPGGVTTPVPTGVIVPAGTGVVAVEPATAPAVVPVAAGVPRPAPERKGGTGGAPGIALTT